MLHHPKNADPSFPNSAVFFDTKDQKRNLAKKISNFCGAKNEFEDIVSYCAPILETIPPESSNSTDVEIGEVYLFKSGRYYKIGKSNDTVRRGRELRVQLPETCHLIHSIKTDDPSGVEAYWHKRFETERKQGEWFDSSPTDVKAFKRWRRIA